MDETDHVIQETSTADPQHPRNGSVFLPADAFPAPIAETWATTKGADLSWLPIPFEKSFQMAYGRTHYGTGYYIYDQYVGGACLSQPISRWDAAPPPGDVLDLLRRAGSDLLPAVDSPQGRQMKLAEKSGVLDLPAAGAKQILALADAPAMLRSLSFAVGRTSALALSKVRLRITWDDRPQPSVDAPLPLFFGAGTLYNRDKRQYLVRSLPASIRFDADQVYLDAYFPMPFFHSARIELVNDGDAIADVHWAVKWTPYADPANHVGYFHATYVDHRTPQRGKDLVLLDTTRAEGGGDWSGQFVGTSFIFSHNARLGTLEGDPRFFFDDSNTPRPRAPAPRNGVAAAITGAARP